MKPTEQLTGEQLRDRILPLLEGQSPATCGKVLMGLAAVSDSQCGFSRGQFIAAAEIAWKHFGGIAADILGKAGHGPN